MAKINFLVQGSAKEPYQVSFSKEGNNLTALCDCPAGQKQQYCKHRFAILSGETSKVVSENIEDVSIVKSWLEGSDVQDALNNMLEKEILLKKANDELKIAKKILARKMHD